MQVACTKCKAQYEFEAAAIPPGGYDAQCTTCGNVFFVAGEPAEAQLTVACSSCSAVYQFPVSAIPPGGYDAQCTQCKAVFFVSATPEVGLGATRAAGANDGAAAGAPAPPGAPPSTSPPVSLPTPAGEPTDAEEAVLLSPEPEETEALAPPAPRLPVPKPARFAKPGVDPTQPTDDELASVFGKRRPVLRVLVAVLAVLAIGGGVAFVAAPQLFVGILTEAPEVGKAIAAARAKMLEDTDAGYAVAAVELDKALTYSPEHGEALALAALVHLFRGIDAAALAKELATGDAASAAIQAKLAETERALGRAMRDRALAAANGSALVQVAAGIVSAFEPDGAAKTAEAQKKSAELRGKAEPDALAAYLDAVAAVGDATRNKDALSLAVGRDAAWQRSRYELALDLDRAGAREEAKKQLTSVLAVVPGHGKAKRLLERWNATGAVAAAPAEVKPPAKVEPPKKEKGKKRKGKRRR
jgi:predicted Zn finger-like uncharacterized protein